jgi:hypothetical protein
MAMIKRLIKKVKAKYYEFKIWLTYQPDTYVYEDETKIKPQK